MGFYMFEFLEYLLVQVNVDCGSCAGATYVYMSYSFICELRLGQEPQTRRANFSTYNSQKFFVVGC